MTEQDAVDKVVKKFVLILGTSLVLCPTFTALAWYTSSWFVLLAWVFALPLVAFTWLIILSFGGRRRARVQRV